MEKVKKTKYATVKIRQYRAIEEFIREWPLVPDTESEILRKLKIDTKKVDTEHGKLFHIRYLQD